MISIISNVIHCTMSAESCLLNAAEDDDQKQGQTVKLKLVVNRIDADLQCIHLQ